MPRYRLKLATAQGHSDLWSGAAQPWPNPFPSQGPRGDAPENTAPKGQADGPLVARRDIIMMLPTGVWPVRTREGIEVRTDRGRRDHGRSGDRWRVVLKALRGVLIWVVRVPVFAFALALYVVTVILSAVMIHGRRAPATAGSLLLRIARLLVANLINRLTSLFSAYRSL